MPEPLARGSSAPRWVPWRAGICEVVGPICEENIVHRKSRRYSALLLLMAPIVVIGSSFLVAGSAGAAVKAKTVSHPTITVCANVAGTKFKVNGHALTVKSCSAVAAIAGVNHVSEVWASPAWRDIAAITVSPTKAKLTASTRSATASVRLAAKGSARVSFRNAHVAAQAGDGTIEVCKYATDNWVVGSFPFTISAGGTTITVPPVPTGQCSGLYTVPSGTVTVTEASESPYYLDAVTTAPAINFGSVDLSTQVATVTVNPNYDTTVNFWNDTAVNEIKVCKTLANNEGALAGDLFSFNVAWVFTPPTGALPISGSATVYVTAVAAGSTACVVYPDPTGKTGIPVGSTVTVTENPFPDVSLTGVSVYPANDGTASVSSGAVFTVLPVADGYASANFTNTPDGYVEVCKDFYPSDYNYNNSATFSVNGGTPFTVQGGGCSVPMAVPAGTATVTETLGAGFFVWNVSTVSATDIFGTRLLSSATANPASVTVPYGDVNNETVVTFTNAPEPTQFKICKGESSEDANLAGQTFEFEYATFDGIEADSVTSASLDGNEGRGYVWLTIADPTPANPTGTVCSGLIWGPPVVGPDGNPYVVAVKELKTEIPAVDITSISYQGAGTAWIPETPATPGTDGAITAFSPGAGINVVTYINGRTA